MRKLITFWIVTLICIMAFADEDTFQLEKSMKAIVIPSIEFKDADAYDALNFLIEGSTLPANDAGIAIELGLIRTNSATATSNRRYVLSDGTLIDLPVLTCAYEHMSLYDLLSKMTEQLGITFTIADNTIILKTKDGRTIERQESVEHVPPGGRGETPRP